MIGAQCLSLYFDPWPWREVNLVLATPQTADLWKRNLQKLKDGAVPMFPDIGSGRPTSTIEYWLRCQYLELQKQNGGMVHVIMALGSFAELRLFKAYKVSEIRIRLLSCLKSSLSRAHYNSLASDMFSLMSDQSQYCQNTLLYLNTQSGQNKHGVKCKMSDKIKSFIPVLISRCQIHTSPFSHCAWPH